MEILLTFDTTTGAIGAEKALLDANIAVKVMNIPSSIRAGCGISLRIAPQDYARSIKLLADNKLAPGSCYKRMTHNGKSSYLPYMEDDQ